MDKAGSDDGTSSGPATISKSRGRRMSFFPSSKCQAEMGRKSVFLGGESFRVISRGFPNSLEKICVGTPNKQIMIHFSQQKKTGIV